MKTGVSSDEALIVRNILVKYPDTCFFGSRAKGTYKKFSDLDICIKGNISDYEMELLHEKFENSDLPFKVDLVLYNRLSNTFKNIVDSEAKPLSKLGVN